MRRRPQNFKKAPANVGQLSADLLNCADLEREWRCGVPDPSAQDSLQTFEWPVRQPPARVNGLKTCQGSRGFEQELGRPAERLKRPEQPCMRRPTVQSRSLITVLEHRRQQRPVPVKVIVDRIKERIGCCFSQQRKHIGQGLPESPRRIASSSIEDFKYDAASMKGTADTVAPSFVTQGPEQCDAFCHATPQDR